jgi:hypothetical protein
MLAEGLAGDASTGATAFLEAAVGAVGPLIEKALA